MISTKDPLDTLRTGRDRPAVKTDRAVDILRRVVARVLLAVEPMPLQDKELVRPDAILHKQLPGVARAAEERTLRPADQALVQQARRLRGCRMPKGRMLLVNHTLLPAEVAQALVHVLSPGTAHDADVYDIRRPGNWGHLAFGGGPHLCAGIALAELQTRAVLRALAARCSNFTLGGEPVRVLNNLLRGYSAAPLAVELAPSSISAACQQGRVT